MYQRNLELIPALLVRSEREFSALAALCGKRFPLLQLDYLDGSLFTKKSSFADSRAVVAEKNHRWELHCMSSNVGAVLAEWSAVPSMDRIAIHAEAYHSAEDARTDLEKIRKAGKFAGLALHPDTSVDLLGHLIDAIDYVLVLCVVPGASGQPFLRPSIKRIKKIHRIYPMLPIAVDGGITPRTAKKCIKAGATILVSASGLFTGDFEENAAAFRHVIEKYRINLL